MELVSAQAQTQSLAAWFSDQFASRRQKNPYFSLRAFARQLGVSPALLSHILRGKRLPSVATAKKMFVRLKISAEEQALLLSLLLDRLRHFNSLNVVEPCELIGPDVAEIVTTWVHYAVLSLGNVEGCRHSPDWISKRLGISEEEARTAMAELVELELIDLIGEGFKQRGANLDTGLLTTSVHQRRFMNQLLDKAKESLERDPVLERCFRTMTCALSPASIELARPLIDEFLDQFEAKFCQEKGSRVYNLGVYLSPLDRGETEEKNV